MEEAPEQVSSPLFQLVAVEWREAVVVAVAVPTSFVVVAAGVADFVYARRAADVYADCGDGRGRGAGGVPVLVSFRDALRPLPRIPLLLHRRQRSLYACVYSSVLRQQKI